MLVNFGKFYVDFVNNNFFSIFFGIFRDFGEKRGEVRILEEKGIGYTN